MNEKYNAKKNSPCLNNADLLHKSQGYKVAGYLRLSQEDGDKDVSDSIVSQKNIIDKKIQEFGEEFLLVDYYIDDGYTGLNTNRPNFQRMLQDIENGTINCIITKDLSRLSRNSFEANYYIEIYFLEKNIRYISVLDNVDTGTKSANNDMIQFKTLINDWYSKDISRKVKSSIWARKEKGLYMGAVAPYGYKKSKEDKHKLIVDKQEARIVKRIYEEYSEGKSITEIINGLQVNNIPSPNNNSNNGEIRYKWKEDTIRRMLSNKVYLGHTEYGKRINLSYKSKKKKYIPPEEWKIAYNTHEPIITEELFDKVQSKKNINKTIKRKKHEWILNGLVKCKECGAKMTLKVEYKRDNPEQLKSKKICCLNGLKRYRGKECIKGSKGLDEEIINDIICKNLNKIIEALDKEKIKNLIIEQENDNKIKRGDDNKALLNKELLKIEYETKTLYLDYKENLLDEDDYKKYYKEKVNEKKRIKNELEVLEKEERHKIIVTEEKVNELVKNILNMKQLNKNIISEIVYDIKIDNNNQIYIYYKYDIFNMVA
ncbi:MAG: recombinase family protein [Clostridia bacterium]|nr:recombinase family protein [Clostridia bacterium]